LLAFFLFGFAVNQIMRFQIYQHSYYYNSSISFLRTIDQWRNNVSSYLNLKNENEGLRQENLLLRGQLSINKSAVNTFKDTTYFDSISKSLNNYKVVYTYIRANIVKNTVNSRNNYFIIDQGKNQGILDGMAVISPTGIVGVLHDSCYTAAMPSAALWAAVPAYASQVPSPKASLSLMRRACEIIGTPAPVASVMNLIERYEEQVNSLVDDDEDLAAYVERLETMSDSGMSLDDEVDDGQLQFDFATDSVDDAADEPDASTLMDEVEQFLREQGDGS
jgi:hypothetical protein